MVLFVIETICFVRPMAYQAMNVEKIVLFLRVATQNVESWHNTDEVTYLQENHEHWTTLSLKRGYYQS